MKTEISASRLGAMVIKEFIQMRRDRLTLAMIIGIPLLQLVLFGYAINSDPKHLPTVIISADHSVFGRTLIEGVRNSGYFQITQVLDGEEEGRQMLAAGKTQFVVNIPVDFARKLVRGERPALLLEADATDPSATSNAVAALQKVVDTVLERDLRGAWADLIPKATPIELRVHNLYNPDVVTQYNVVPGLMGVVLTMTMVMVTALAVTRERERGTMENLLAMPVRPLEVMMGKILPYIIVGYIQVLLIILVARFLFAVPMLGSIVLLLLVSLVFIAANLAVGIVFSTIAKNQLQALQMSFFFFLPSMILSGFMFPFRGMPNWAQWIGSVLPLTHFLRIVRGILLKGNGLMETIPHLWPITAFLVLVLLFGVMRYRKTLD